MSGSPESETPIHPRTATNLVELKQLLVLLRERAGNPSFNQIEALAGPGQLSHATAHRLLASGYDLARIQNPGRAVGVLVTTLGEDPAPWAEAVERLVWEAKNPTALREPAPAATTAAGGRTVVDRLRRLSRRRKVLLGAGACVVVAAIVVPVVLAGAPAKIAAVVDHDRPVAIELGTGGLRIALEDATERLGAAAVVREAAAPEVATWLVTAPYRANANAHQLRHLDGGRELVCLEVRDRSQDDDVAVQFSGCTGETHQYWRWQPTAQGFLRVTNLNSGKCLSVAGAGEPQSGMHVVQRPCDDARLAQQWKTTPATAPPQSTAQFAGSLDPAELPHGGKDKPCDGLPALDVAATTWTSEKHSVRQISPPRGQVRIRTDAAYAELYFANTLDRTTGTEESYYWVEGWTKFTPDRFRMYLQWTTVRGPGGWHTCQYRLPEQGTVKSVAIPRDSAPHTSRDVQFRICLSYRPVLGDLILECSADRY